MHSQVTSAGQRVAGVADEHSPISHDRSLVETTRHECNRRVRWQCEPLANPHARSNLREGAIGLAHGLQGALLAVRYVADITLYKSVLAFQEGNGRGAPALIERGVIDPKLLQPSSARRLRICWSESHLAVRKRCQRVANASAADVLREGADEARREGVAVKRRSDV